MKKLIYLSLCLLMLFGCRKDIDEQIKEKDIFQPDVTYFPVLNPVRASVLVTVIDEMGDPIEYANLELGSLRGKTDEKGQFLFSKVKMNQSGTYIKVEAWKKIDGASLFFPLEDSENYVTVRLMKEVEAGTFDSSLGGLITGDGGFEISFPSNSIKYTNGSGIYDGEVSVFARWINPEDETLGEIMPGNLQGINEQEEEVALVTYGMLAVELKTPSGQSLQLVDNQSATLTFPLSAELLSNAPSTIPLWYFNETVGTWVEEGSAVLSGNSYVGEVSHFSFWNCDAPFPLIELSGALITDKGYPIADAWVYIETNVNNTPGEGVGIRTGQTNSDGYFSGKVPANMDLKITFSKLLDACTYSIVIEDNYEVNTNLGNMEVVQGELLNLAIELKGCSDDPVSGLLEVGIGSRLNTYYYDDVSQVELGVLNCEMAEELTIKFIDVENLSESNEVVFPITINDSLTINNFNVCTNTANEFMKIFIDGYQSNIIDPYILIGNDTASFLGNVQGGDNYIEFNTGIELELGENDVEFIDYLFMGAGSIHGQVSTYCRGASCEIVDNITITELGDINEKVIGNFSGIAEFYDLDTIARELPFLVEFEIIRE